jgi:hypothetical protein
MAMQVTLNTEETILCTIGSYSFTLGEPGPLSVDVSLLNETEAKQFWYNIQRKILQVDDMSELKEKLDATPQRQNIQMAHPKPPVPKKSFEDLIKENEKELKKLLAGNVATIKKNAQTLRTGQLRKLLSLEKEGKARKSVIKFVDELLEKYTSAITGQVGNESLEAEDMVKVSELSTQLTDVVESEVEEVTFSLPEDEEV